MTIYYKKYLDTHGKVIYNIFRLMIKIYYNKYMGEGGIEPPTTWPPAKS